MTLGRDTTPRAPLVRDRSPRTEREACKFSAGFHLGGLWQDVPRWFTNEEDKMGIIGILLLIWSLDLD